MQFSEIIKNHSELIFNSGTFNWYQMQQFGAIKNCRTRNLGGHWYYCEHCNASHLLYNSCRNRHCPICQGEKRVKWVAKQCRNLLNIPYYHVVFTIPHELNNLFLNNPSLCYHAFFKAVWDTLKGFFASDKYLGGKGGMFCILHTWGQEMVYHPHIHCIVPGAGITFNNEFKILRTRDKYLFHTQSMALVFRAKLMQRITELEKLQLFTIAPIIRKLIFGKKWVVFCKRPFGNPKAFVEYIGRYSHRVAISENRIVDDSNGKISFTYKDYANQSVIRTMQLSALDFFKRFALHFLPRRFTKIRHYGLMSNACRKQFIKAGEMVVGKADNTSSAAEQELEPDNTYGQIKKHCPVCKHKSMRKIFGFTAMQLLAGLIIINQASGEVLYQSRDGPLTDGFVVYLFGN